MDVLDGFQELVHVGFDFVLVEVFVADEAFVEVLLHQLKNQG